MPMAKTDYVCSGPSYAQETMCIANNSYNKKRKHLYMDIVARSEE